MLLSVDKTTIYVANGLNGDVWWGSLTKKKRKDKEKSKMWWSIKAHWDIALLITD